MTQKIKDGYFTGLGVNALWLTVPMDNTDGTGLGDDGRQYTAYHGYWPRDLTKTEKRFGTGAELKALIDEAHKVGIKILIDYAMNHVHKDSPVYAMHMSDGWFNPLDLGGGKQCICGSPECGWDDPNKAKVCWFRDYLPDFNFNNAGARLFNRQRHQLAIGLRHRRPAPGCREAHRDVVADRPAQPHHQRRREQDQRARLSGWRDLLRQPRCDSALCRPVHQAGWAVRLSAAG